MSSRVQVRIFVLFTVLAAVFCGCSHTVLREPLCIGGSSVSSESIARINRRKIEKGYGAVEFCIEREKVRADFDLYTSNNGNITAVFYSLLGTEAGRIETFADSMNLSIAQKNMTLSLNDKLDTLGYMWSKYVTAGDFLSLMRGVIPGRFIESGADAAASENSKMSLRVICSDNKNSAELLFFSRFSNLTRIILDYSVQGNSFLIDQSGFMDGIPKKTMFGIDSENYFRVSYRKILTP